MIKQWLTLLYNSDPSALRLKQAAKTILAIFLTLAAVHPFPHRFMLLSSGMAAGFMMQSNQGVTRKQQMLTALIAYPCIIFFYTSALILRPYPLAITAFLTITGFLAFYSQRFGQSFSKFPLFCWAFSFTGTLFPVQTWPQITYDLLGAFLAAIISFLVYFFIFPKRPAKIFFQNLRNYYETYRKTISWLTRYYQERTTSAYFAEHASQKMQELRKVLMLNEGIYNSLPNATSTLNRLINEQYLEQFAKAKAIGMIIESTQKLAENDIHLNATLRKALIKLTQLCLVFLRSFKINTNDFQVVCHFDTDQLKKPLLHLQEEICKSPLYQSEDVIYLLNIHLGFRQLSKNIREHYEN